MRETQTLGCAVRDWQEHGTRAFYLAFARACARMLTAPHPCSQLSLADGNDASAATADAAPAAPAAPLYVVTDGSGVAAPHPALASGSAK